MTHEDAGHYAAKHHGATIDPLIAAEINVKQADGRITCAAAHDIANALKCSPKEVGITIDLLEKRISKCQMGLFGYGDKKGKAVQPSARVTPELEATLRTAMRGDRITCEAAWEVARRLRLAKIEVACACEALGIKVTACQLGAF